MPGPQKAQKAQDTFLILGPKMAQWSLLVRQILKTNAARMCESKVER
jgi:hypothetical protein